MRGTKEAQPGVGGGTVDGEAALRRDRSTSRSEEKKAKEGRGRGGSKAGRWVVAGGKGGGILPAGLR